MQMPISYSGFWELFSESTTLRCLGTLSQCAPLGVGIRVLLPQFHSMQMCLFLPWYGVTLVSRSLLIVKYM
jgi:hypothetical protein